jgi:hypothetical protein
MRWISLRVAVLAVALINPVAPSSGAPPRLETASTEAVVDLELALAVDVSLSMDLDELAVQREGYAEAIVSKEFLDALKSGPRGKVAITYFEWSSAYDQKTIIPWRIVDGPESADSVAAEIMRTPVRRGGHTSISGAIGFAMQTFAANPYRGLRRVIDVSGDGANNSGEPVLTARDAALAAGVTINGLAVMIKSIKAATDIEHLDIYYEDCVIGGPGSFVISIKERAELKTAIRTKLILEVAGVQPPPTMIPIQARKASVPCTIGEETLRGRRDR